MQWGRCIKWSITQIHLIDWNLKRNYHTNSYKFIYAKDTYLVLHGNRDKMSTILVKLSYMIL